MVATTRQPRAKRAEKPVASRTPTKAPRSAKAVSAPAQRATGATQPSPTLSRVHETVEAVAAVEMTPPHPPRVETPEYARAHHFLIYTKGAPCQVCGVTLRTIKNPRRNPFKATAMETHHYPIERSLMDACDPRKVHADYPQVYDRATLAAFVDSPANLIPLCDVHHRSVEHGIHHLLPQDFAIQKYLLDAYVIAASAKDAAAVLAADESLVTAGTNATGGNVACN